MGYEVIHQLEKWGSAILAALFVVLSLRILQQGGIALGDTVHGGAAVGAFVLMSTIAFAGAFSWASYAADYSRYQRKDTRSSPISGGPMADLRLLRLDVRDRPGWGQSAEPLKRRTACAHWLVGALWEPWP